MIVIMIIKITIIIIIIVIVIVIVIGLNYNICTKLQLVCRMTAKMHYPASCNTYYLVKSYC